MNANTKDKPSCTPVCKYTFYDFSVLSVIGLPANMYRSLRLAAFDVDMWNPKHSVLEFIVAGRRQLVDVESNLSCSRAFPTQFLFVLAFALRRAPNQCSDTQQTH